MYLLQTLPSYSLFNIIIQFNPINLLVNKPSKLWMFCCLRNNKNSTWDTKIWCLGQFWDSRETYHYKWNYCIYASRKVYNCLLASLDLTHLTQKYKLLRTRGRSFCNWNISVLADSSSSASTQLPDCTVTKIILTQSSTNTLFLTKK